MILLPCFGSVLKEIDVRVVALERTMLTQNKSTNQMFFY